MPETYTKEQIEEAKAQARFYVINGHLIPNECGAILLSALESAEQERDALKARCAELEARLQGDCEKRDVSSIVEKWLRNHGFDGLKRDECGCSLEDDFMPCGGDYISDCEAAYKHNCDKCGGCDGGDFCMQSEPPAIVGKKEG